jgi:hypothetical protein
MKHALEGLHPSARAYASGAAFVLGALSGVCRPGLNGESMDVAVHRWHPCSVCTCRMWNIFIEDP